MARPRTLSMTCGWLAVLVWVATNGIGLAGAEPPQGLQRSVRMIHQGNEERTRMQLERYFRLPDLLNIARESGTKDLYAEQERLAREHDTQKRPYRLSMPYRNPGRPCQSGTHVVATVKYSLVNPVRNEKAELWEAELHEAQAHGAALPAPVAAFLERLTYVE